jgi:hypothetical protein
VALRERLRVRGRGEGVVATCWHVPEDRSRARTGLPRRRRPAGARVRGPRGPSRADAEGRRGLAAQPSSRTPPPLPLSGGVRQGARIYCLSNPDERHASFCEGSSRGGSSTATSRGAKAETRPKGVARAPGHAGVRPRQLGGPDPRLVRENVVGLAQSTQAVLSSDDKDPAALADGAPVRRAAEALLGPREEFEVSPGPGRYAPADVVRRPGLDARAHPAVLLRPGPRDPRGGGGLTVPPESPVRPRTEKSPKSSRRRSERSMWTASDLYRHGVAQIRNEANPSPSATPPGSSQRGTETATSCSRLRIHQPRTAS